MILVDGEPDPAIGVAGQYARDRGTRALWKKEQADTFGPAMWVQVAAPQMLKGEKGDKGDPGGEGGGLPRVVEQWQAARLGVGINPTLANLEVQGDPANFQSASYVYRFPTGTSGSIDGMRTSMFLSPTGNTSATYSGISNAMQEH